MQKAIAIIIFGLLLSGCSGHLSTNIDSRFEHEMEITPLDKKSLGEIKSMANKKCKGLNRGLAVNLQRLEHSVGFKYYGFNCEKSEMAVEEEEKQEEENKKQI